MKLEIKDLDLRFEMKAEDDGAMTITGYGSTFGGAPDAVGDIVAAGAFVKSLKARMPKMLYQHRSDRICGKWIEAREDGKGLLLKGIFLDTTLGRDAYQEAKAGALDSMSIGFRTLKYSHDKNDSIRTLEEVDLFEVSLVTFPANANATIDAVKTVLTERDAEDALREAGFSRKKAKAIVAGGFKTIDDQRDADPAVDGQALDHLSSALKDFTNIFHS